MRTLPLLPIHGAATAKMARLLWQREAQADQYRRAALQTLEYAPVYEVGKGDPVAWVRVR